MEQLNLILGIAASIMSIISVVWNASNTKKINNIQQSIKAGDNSVNTIGNKNKING